MFAALAGKTITPEQRTQFLDKIVLVNRLLHPPQLLGPEDRQVQPQP